VVVGGPGTGIWLCGKMVAARLPVGLPQLTESLLEYARRCRQRQAKTHRTSWQGDRNHVLGHFSLEQYEAGGTHSNLDV